MHGMRVVGASSTDGYKKENEKTTMYDARCTKHEARSTLWTETNPGMQSRGQRSMRCDHFYQLIIHLALSCAESD